MGCRKKNMEYVTRLYRKHLKQRCYQFCYLDNKYFIYQCKKLFFYEPGESVVPTSSSTSGSSAIDVYLRWSMIPRKCEIFQPYFVAFHSHWMSSASSCSNSEGMGEMLHATPGDPGSTRRIHKNSGRVREPGSSTRTRRFSTEQNKYIRRILKCLDSMLLKTRSRLNPRGCHIYEFGAI